MGFAARPPVRRRRGESGPRFAAAGLIGAGLAADVAISRSPRIESPTRPNRTASMAKTRVPRPIIAAVVGICVLPSVLTLLGVDLGSPNSVIDPDQLRETPAAADNRGWQ